MFVFTKEMADLSGKIRKKASLFQKEIAEKIGLSSKSFAYISFLENGKIKKPTLLILVPSVFSMVFLISVFICG